MNDNFSRRQFLRTSAAAGASMGLGQLANVSALAAPEGSEPLFKISLAEWSFHRVLKAGKMDNLDFPVVAKREFGIDCVEYVNQFFKDKAKDDDVPEGPEEAVRRQRRQERAHHVRRRGRPGRSGRSEANEGRREPLQVGRGRQVPRLPFDPRQRPVRPASYEEQHEAGRRRPAAGSASSAPSTTST